MSDQVLDIKDIKGIVEEGLQTTKGNWEKARKEDQEAFDSKVQKIVSDIEAKGFAAKGDVEKHVKEMQDQFDELATKMNKQDPKGSKKVSFKSSIAESLKEKYDEISSAEKIKGTKTIGLKDIDYTNFDDFESNRTDFQSGIIAKDRDVFHLRQILNVGSTDKEYIDVPREGDKTGDGPAPWARGADIASTDPKASFEPNFTKYKAQIEWIAGIMRLPVEMLADLPWLTSYLQSFAQAELLVAEDNQILNGNGTSPQLDGLMPNATSYNGDYTVAIERLVDAAYGQLAEAYHAPTNMLLHPRDVVSLILNKATGSGEYDLPGGTVGFVNGQLQVAGINVNKTTQITQGDFLLGDFNKAQIVQRMAPQLRFFEQDQDNVIKNLVTVRIEERLALAIFKTNAFVKGTLAVPAG